MTASRQTEYLAHIADLIDTHGWAVQAVFDPHDASAVFSYTAGLTAKGLPELWIGTLSPEHATMVLNAVAHQLVADPARAVPGPLALDEEWSVEFRLRGPVDVEAGEANVAKALAVVDPVRLLQVVWPDDRGAYPDEYGYDADRFPQRLLPEVVSGG